MDSQDQDSQVLTQKDLEPEKGQLTLDDLIARANPNDPKAQKLLKAIQKLSKRQDQVASDAPKSSSSSGSSTPKSRGRPKGSKNRTKEEALAKPKGLKRAMSSSDVGVSPKKRVKKETSTRTPTAKVVDLTVNDGANVKEGNQITSFKLTSSLSLEHSPWENNGKWYVGLRRVLANPKKNQSESMFINLGTVGLRNLEKAVKMMIEFLGKSDSPVVTKPKTAEGVNNISDDEEEEEDEETDFSSSTDSDETDI